MLQPNLSLNLTRQTKADQWRHALVANTPTPAIYTEVKDGSNVFPLYLYPNRAELPGLEEPSKSPGGRHPNFSSSFIAVISTKLGMQFIPDGKGDLQVTLGPEDIFSYMYALFYSPTYRERYAEFLKRDFPRVPLTSNTDLFCALCAIGNKLIELHLMQRYGEHQPKYPEPGNNLVEKVEYTQPRDIPAQGRAWINKTQYFDGVPPEVWEFHIGGYQVCEKWLKDRKGRVLTYDERKHYQRIVASLAETITLMEQIDEIIDEYAGWPIE